MTQSIIIQVGQCGNQIGYRFWDLALREHANHNKKGVYNDSMSGFFRNSDPRSEYSNLPSSNKNKICSLKARAVLVDMEEGVVSEILNGPLSELFDHRQLITDVSGSGNNWAVGHHEYGPKYREAILDAIRRAAEFCDCLQCFFIMHSMGGGTGSGVGTYILHMLKDEFPEVYRFVTAIFPSEDDDVITSPYNGMLALHQLSTCADFVIPVENQALSGIVNKIQTALPPVKSTTIKGSSLIGSEGGVQKSSKPFDTMNNIVANLLLNLTCSSRFEGTLNVDLNEITMNLVPFPRMHYAIASQTPLYTLSNFKIPTRKLDTMFTEAFSQDYQLIRCEPKKGTYLACALIVRGQVEISDIRRNIDRLKPSLNFVHWNGEGWKTGLCSVAPVGHPYSLLTLANNSAIRHSFDSLNQRFIKLYRRKAHLHHYTRINGMEDVYFDECFNSLADITESYTSLENSNASYQNIPRLKIAS